MIEDANADNINKNDEVDSYTQYSLIAI